MRMISMPPQCPSIRFRRSIRRRDPSKETTYDPQSDDLCACIDLGLPRPRGSRKADVIDTYADIAEAAYGDSLITASRWSTAWMP